MRHGQTDWNRQPARCQGWSGRGLTAKGRRQALERGRMLSGRGVELIVTSHLRRAVETAELLGEELGGRAGPPLVLDPRLAETQRGTWEGRAFSDIMVEELERWRAYRDRPQDFRFPGGESLVQHQRRVLAALRDVALDGRTSVLVTHGGSIRVVRCFLSGEGLRAFHDSGTGNGGVLEVPAQGLAGRIDGFLREA